MAFEHIQLRRDTAANWTANNPILLLGETGWETDTLKTKLGDGVTAWNSLAYDAGSVAQSNVLALLASTAAGQGDALLGVQNPWLNALATTQYALNSAGAIHLYPEYLTAAQLADAQTAAVNNTVGSLDTTAAWQAGITAAITAQKKLVCPWGSFKISSTLMMVNWSGSAFGFVSVDIEGERAGWDFPNSASQPASTIVNLIGPVNQPAVVIQNGRMCSLKNIGFRGTNNIYGLNLGGAGGGLTLSINNFNQVGALDTRYAPYAGLVIDPFTTAGGAPSVPAWAASTFFPTGAQVTNSGKNYVCISGGVTASSGGPTSTGSGIVDGNATWNYEAAPPTNGGYQGTAATGVTFAIYYTGASNTSGSSGIVLENVFCENFIVGLAHQPGGGTTQGDQVICKNCWFSYNKFGTSTSTPNAFALTFLECEFYMNYLAMDGLTYGYQQGIPPKVIGGQAVFCKYLFNFSCSFGGSMLVAGLHAENIGGIGFLGIGSSVQYGAAFSGCEFNFGDFNGTGVADWVLLSNTPVVFEGCGFNTLSQAYQAPMRFQNNSASLTFRGCGFTESSVGELTAAFSVGIQGWDQEFVTFENCVVSETTKGNSTTSILTHRKITAFYEDLDPTPMGALTSGVLGTTGQLLLNGSLLAENSVSIGSVTVTVGTNGRATFPATAGTVRVGDLVFGTNGAVRFDGPSGPGTINTGWVPLGVVTNVAGTTVTVNGIPSSWVTGTYTLASEWYPRSHNNSVGAGSTATWTTSNANITIVSGTWKIGHHIKGTGIPAGVYIASGTSPNFVLSQTPTGNGTAARIYDANLYVITGTAL